jgi:hypothetical protein
MLVKRAAKICDHYNPLETDGDIAKAGPSHILGTPRSGFSHQNEMNHCKSARSAGGQIVIRSMLVSTASSKEVNWPGFLALTGSEESQKAPRGEIAARGAGAPLWEDSVASECIL